MIKSTPAVKRLREETPVSSEKMNKKSRIMSPSSEKSTKKSLNSSLNLELSDSSDLHDDSPVKKTSSRKVLIESDSE